MIFIKDYLCVKSEYNEINDKWGTNYWQFWHEGKLLYVKKGDAGVITQEDGIYKLEVKHDSVKMVLYGSTIDEVIQLYVEGLHALQNQSEGE